MLSFQEIEKVSADIEHFLEACIISLAENLTANLVEATPIKTGFARSNWLPSIGTALLATVGQKQRLKARRRNRRQQDIKFGAQWAGAKKLQGYKLSRGSIFISNNTPYIHKLDAGSSRQAPAGYIAMTIEKTIQQVFQLGVTYDSRD